jgi:hypothetical protein
MRRPCQIAADAQCLERIDVLNPATRASSARGMQSLPGAADFAAPFTKH